MGVRQALNENPLISTVATSAIIVVALVFIFLRLGGGHQNHPPVAGKMFYSDDDGKTYFPDEANKMTPFPSPNNRPAVGAMVFQCRGGPPFVAYLSRYTDEGRKIAEKLAAESSAPGGRLPNSSLMEVKKPGAKTWIKFDPKIAKAYIDVTIPHCPNGGTDLPKPIYPSP